MPAAPFVCVPPRIPKAVARRHTLQVGTPAGYFYPSAVAILTTFGHLLLARPSPPHHDTPTFALLRSAPSMIEFRYRPDVDGLRAVAVMLVVLFHAGLGFPGGYIGVDVFFVISGFLITGLIFKEQEAGEFQLSRFWLRRVRRILPASLALALAALIAAYFVLWPSDFKRFGASLAAQQLMLSNVYFYRNVNYFTGSSDLIPLLHTWSLAVEEQFYLFYPFLLALLSRLRWKTKGILLTVLAVVSLWLGISTVETNQPFAFYMLPGRAWELLVGGLLWFLPRPRNVSASYREALSLVGMALILGSSLYFDKNTMFPGWTAAPPCLGAALVIYSGSLGSSLVGSLLRQKPVVFVGLISYSLYLWHWPIMAFVRYRFGEELSLSQGLACLLASFLAGALSWRLVETPFRKKQILVTPRRIVVGAIVASTLLLLAGAGIRQKQGLPDRYDSAVQKLLAAKKTSSMPARYIVKPDHVRKDKLPCCGDLASSECCLIWGDSHAMDLVPALDQACQAHGLKLYIATHPSTAPLVGFQSESLLSLKEASREFNDLVLRHIANHKTRAVFLAGFWSTYAERQTEFATAMQQTVDAVQKQGAHALIVKDVACTEYDVPYALARTALEDADLSTVALPLSEHRNRNRQADSSLERASEWGARVLDPAPYFSNAAGQWQFAGEGISWYRDNQHLTQTGALRLIPLFDEVLSELLRKPL